MTDTDEAWRKRSEAQHVGRGQVGAMLISLSWKVARRLPMGRLLAVFLCCGVVVLLPCPLLAQSPARGLAYINGNTLYQACTSKDFDEIFMCRGYILGVVDSNEAFEAHGVNTNLCISKDIEAQQLYD